MRAALEQVRSGKAAKLVFQPGRYDFHPERASQQYLFVSNNDEGLKRIAFHIRTPHPSTAMKIDAKVQ